MFPSKAELHFLLAGPPPAADDVLLALAAHDDLPTLTPGTGSPWSLVRTDGPESWQIELARAPTLRADTAGMAELSERQRAALRESKWCLIVRTTLPPDARVPRFHRMLQLGFAASTAIVGLFDPGAQVVRDPRWLRDATAPGVPLGSDALFRIAGRGDGRQHWLYTIGLRRCGLPEIEALDVGASQLQLASAVLTAVASRAVLNGLPPLGESVLYGHNLEAALVPWRYVQADIGAEIGGPDDRDDDHPDSDLALVVWEPTSSTTGVWRTVMQDLHDDDPPVLLLTDYETERLEALSRLRWRSFASLVDTYGDAKGWRFLAKFGYGGADGTTREHLWFDVHRADALTAEATLLNAPFQDLGLTEGERGRHSIDHLTDFRVGSPVGTATPESLDKLLSTLVATMDTEAH